MDEQRVQKALDFISQFGDTDGGHHKQWALDQVVRILTGCPTITKTGVYDGTEYTYEMFGVSPEYQEWVKEQMNGEDGPETYWWDEGTPP